MSIEFGFTFKNLSLMKGVAVTITSSFFATLFSYFSILELINFLTIGFKYSFERI